MLQKESFKSFIYKCGFNIWPCIRGTGVWVTYISKDFRHIKIKLPLSWRTRNRVGTVFGGSIYACTDPFYMLMFMEVLGKSHVVWDKGATIRFKRPAKETLFAEFQIDDELLERVKKETHTNGEYSFEILVKLVNKDNIVFSEVNKVVYTATKEFYKKKLELKKAKAAKI